MDNIEIIDIDDNSITGNNNISNNVNTNINSETNNVSNDNKIEFDALGLYGEDLTAKTYVSNPAIAREDEIKKLIVVLLTPDKSGLLIGKAGIGKTAIVEGLAYKINHDEVPNAIKGYRVIKINSTS